jgi:methylenetetrahydrofolate--tRNA-(uracil-5-)-methyltransferase
MNEGEFKFFCDELKNAERVEIRDFEPDKLFEACLPIELLASRDCEALRFGALKPVGLKDPETGKRPYAVVQLRREDKMGECLNLVGFQTRLKFSEQKRVFSMIPALKNARWVKLGHMHKNFYLDASKLLDEFLRLKSDQRAYFAGQITGGEGYLEAISQGFTAGLYISMKINGMEPVLFPDETMLGAFSKALIKFDKRIYEPQKVSFGMLPPLEKEIRGKRPRREKLVERSLTKLMEYMKKQKP